MPLLKIQTSVTVPPPRKAQLLAEGSRLLAEITGKPEKYVMVTLEAADVLMAGAAGPAAFLDVRGIGGLTKAVNGKLTKAFCDLLQRELAIDPARVYVTFTDVAAPNWGCNGTTFG
jgi:phenylpyruvate tautomerase